MTLGDEEDDGLGDQETMNGEELDESVRIVANNSGRGGMGGNVGGRGGARGGGGLPGMQGGVDDVTAMILRQVSESHSAIAQAMKSNEEGVKEIVQSIMDHGRKRPAEREKEEEKPKLTDQMMRVKDDNNTVIDGKIRNLVGKNPNSSEPSSWWSAEFSSVAHPELGEGLCLNHLGPGLINPDVVLKIHDRKKVVTVKELLTANSGYGGNLEESISAKRKNGRDGGSWEFAETKSLKNAVKLEEVVEAGLNYCMVVFMVRSWDYSALAMIRVAHAVRFFKVRTEIIEKTPSFQIYLFRGWQMDTWGHRSSCWSLTTTGSSRRWRWRPSRGCRRQATSSYTMRPRSMSRMKATQT